MTLAAPSDVVIPLLAALAVTVVLWFALAPFVKNRNKRGLLITILLGLFYVYGLVVDYTSTGLSKLDLTIAGAAQGAYAVVVLLAAFVVVRATRSANQLNGPTTFLNVASACCVVVALLSIGQRSFAHRRAAEDTQPVQVAVQSERPNIYYIVVDAYGREDVLKDFFDVDNRPFTEFLESQGFYVAPLSSSNYHWTVVSLSATLNMGYHEHPNPIALDLPLGDLVRNSQVFRNFKDLGYTLVSFASGFSATELRDADIYTRPAFALSEFDDVLIRATALRAVGQRFGAQLLHRLQTSRILHTLDQLEHMEAPPEPYFVFAHVLSPHGPWVFSDVKYPMLTDAAQQAKAFHQFVHQDAPVGYREEVLALNERLKAAIQSIRQRDPNAVVILQGDHGPRGLMGGNPENWEDYVRKYTAILNAIYLPGKDPNQLLYPSISPVNTFRVIFNAYFGADLPLLKDHRFLRPPNQPINDWVHGEYIQEDRVY